MPKPRSNESKKNYMRRCVAYIHDKEGKDYKQAAGQCAGMYDQMKKKARRRANAR